MNKMGNPTPPPDHYAALEISRNATEAEITRAARKRRIETHPDKFAGKSLTQKELDAINDRAKCVGRAADVLCDATARRKYDEELAQWRKYDEELAQWKAQQKAQRAADERAKESARTRHAAPTASKKPDDTRHATQKGPSKPDDRKEAPRDRPQSSRWGERVRQSSFFNRNKGETRGRSDAEADEATHARKPSSSTRPRSEAPRRQDQDNRRQERDAPRKDRDVPRQDRDSPGGQKNRHLVGNLSVRPDGYTNHHLVGTLSARLPARAGSERKSSRHGVEKNVRFEQNVRFARDAKDYDGSY